MKNILDLNINELEIWMKEHKQSSFRAAQIFQWIYKRVYDFDNMTNIPKSLINDLKKEYYIEIPNIVKSLVSQLDETVKLLYRFSDGNIIEAVVMKYKHGNTICISSQVGCRMGCKFCASTIDGMVRNLSAGEMISEILCAEDFVKESISHIVIMGSGEPMDNYDNIIKFIDLANSKHGLNIGQRKITISTCGIVPKIIQMADRKYQITLAISLHASTDEKRKEIMPIANKYSIDEVIKACRYYINMTSRRITFEYALISDVNDSNEDAENLVKLLQGLLCHVNLIPVNNVREREYHKSSKDRIHTFKTILERNGIQTTVRRELGADINAACGQLRKNYMDYEKK
ncbi:23S rRNA (adenine(2503)-C(2))-methyltransferase RlmN [Clostridium oryzae]|uniref:Probable dual-specificity RNA methyltransferase RlmN n=1 Tax=Clostridium oryzae TaxID=1450648 RepID=A0A1V4INZ0_9CLOT|nr:23S rRNA (adenine(2503)-C(2))-methyltransferase RlmN [Clostridium oryzae]OPJ61758.1 putative dual-specificity RNA methyltransferase RlmN [Clostridium oryzae]